MRLTRTCEDVVAPIAQEGTTYNRYTIVGRIAGGGMADIFLAHSASDAGVERYVVLKRVLAERRRDPQLVAMLVDEARLAAQLHHANIAQVDDVGTLGGFFFYTMEYVHGEDLRGILHRLGTLGRPFPINVALYIVASALAGLGHAHTRRNAEGKPLGIVHRDVSPSNVMVSYEGAVKLIDFGVAKATERTAESSAGTVKGKIAYCSPEQCRGEPLDARSDLFSLGIVAYEMLTGQRLYRRESDFNTMMAIVSEQVVPPSRFRPEVPPAVDHIVMTALAKDARDRHASAADMLDAIEAVAAGEHLALSSTGTGRLMRELFGHRPEPWVKLPSVDSARSITVTSESVIGVGVLTTPLSVQHSAFEIDTEIDVDIDAALEAQLDEAPTLWGAGRTEGSPPSVRTLASQIAQGAPGAAPVTGRGTPSERVAAVQAGPPVVASPSDTRPPMRASTPSAPFPVASAPVYAHQTPSAPFPIAPAPVYTHQTPPGPFPAAPDPLRSYQTPPGPFPAAPTPMRGQQAPFPLAHWNLTPPPFPGASPHRTPSAPFPAAWGPAPANPHASLGYTPEPTIKVRHVTRPKGVLVLGLVPKQIMVSAVAAVVTIGLAFLVLSLVSRGAPPSRAEATSGGSAATPPGSVVERAGSAVAPPAPAGAATHPVEAPVVAPPARPPTIADAVQKADWAGALRICAGVRPGKLTPDERTSCGIAACHARERRAAASYYAFAAVPGQVVIERACRAENISLLAPQASKDGCGDPKFRKQNPLKCQK